MQMPATLEDGPSSATITIVLAHGAGAPMDSPFMDAFAKGLAAESHRVIRFEFPYMAARREGRRPGPDNERKLLDTWREVATGFVDSPSLVIGGKSMGGRMASMVADELGVAGLVCLGYPFHAPGRPERPRVAHLQPLATPALIVQGTRDPFGTQEDIATYRLSPNIQFHWLADGDHDFKPRAGSGRTQAQNWGEGITAVARFLQGLG
jgi:predicted alpha/beta-hydrolase family hydrolase